MVAMAKSVFMAGTVLGIPVCGIIADRYVVGHFHMFRHEQNIHYLQYDILKSVVNFD